MDRERLQAIKMRVTRNESAPDVPALARELITELERRFDVDEVKSRGVGEVGPGPVDQAANLVVDQPQSDAAPADDAEAPKHKKEKKR